MRESWQLGAIEAWPRDGNNRGSQEMKTLLSRRGDESQPKSVMFCLIPETFTVI